MRGKLAIFLCGFLALAGYVASPFASAWTIREAIHNGDAATLQNKIDWPQVKASLKSSMSTYALGPGHKPAAAAATASPTPRPGLWQRLKNAYGRRVVASMVDRLATPASLPRLFAYRKSFDERVRGLPDERKVYSLFERMKRAWSRVTRAEFLTPTRFAMEMRDKVVAHRSYHGILQLKGLTWKLVHLEVRRIETANAAGTQGWRPMTSRGVGS